MNCPWVDAGPKDEQGRRVVRCGHCQRSLPNPTASAPERIIGCLLPTQPEHIQQQPPLPPHGPGTEAARIFKELGIEQGGCKCPERQRQMDQWGVDGCQANRETIVAWFKEAASELTLIETVTAGAKLMRTDWFDRKRPHDSILSEAIRRCQPAPAAR